MKRFLCWIWLLMATAASAQVSDGMLALPDTLKPFSFEDYQYLILKNHPVAKQAALLSEVAKQEVRLARGNFDPKVEASLMSKKLEDKEYYSRASGFLKIPTAIPINPFVGVERNTGPFLDPENYISESFDYSQYSAGISVPLGRGLFTDERRTALRQAQLFREMTEADQVKIINKLLLDAAKDYWDWYYTFHQWRLLTKNVSIAADIFSRVKTDFQYGESARIDTVQAKITLQQRLLERQESWLQFQNATIRLSNALWSESGDPVAIDPSVGPVIDNQVLVTESELEHLRELAKNNHPELRKIDVKLRQLETERRLAAEFLKPRLDLTYYALNQPLTPDHRSNFDLLGSYKLGVDFSMPIFLRKERSKLALTKLKITNTQWEQSLAERQILNEVNATYNQVTNLFRLMNTQRDMVNNYEIILQAELTNLSEGESDLFKINLQQEKLVQSQTKWLKLTAELEKQRAYLYWAAGTRRLGE